MHTHIPSHKKHGPRKKHRPRTFTAQGMHKHRSELWRNATHDATDLWLPVHCELHAENHSICTNMLDQRVQYKLNGCPGKEARRVRTCRELHQRLGSPAILNLKCAQVAQVMGGASAEKHLVFALRGLQECTSDENSISTWNQIQPTSSTYIIFNSTITRMPVLACKLSNFHLMLWTHMNSWRFPVWKHCLEKTNHHMGSHWLLAQCLQKAHEDGILCLMHSMTHHAGSDPEQCPSHHLFEKSCDP